MLKQVKLDYAGPLHFDVHLPLHRPQDPAGFSAAIVVAANHLDTKYHRCSLAYTAPTSPLRCSGAWPHTASLSLQLDLYR